MSDVENPERLARLVEANYSDGLSAPTESASAVNLAMNFFNQDGSIPDPAGLSAMFIFWGQFIDHDLDLSGGSTGEFIQVPGLAFPIERSNYDETTGIDSAREQINQITQQIDASMIYGSNSEREAELRSFTGGRLAGSNDTKSEFDLLPDAHESQEMEGRARTDQTLFLAGDVRANENSNLIMLQTVFLREHNHWADRLGAENPDWSDDELFAAARSIVEAEIQKITYQDWLPNLIGTAANEPSAVLLDPANGTISNEFSTAAFRFGHTMVPDVIQRLNEDGSSIDPMNVRDQLFNPDSVRDQGIDELLRGNAATAAETLDTKVVDGLNFLVPAGPAGLAGFSLPLLNITRGRDHGLASWLDTREAVVGDVDAATVDLSDFSILTSDTEIQTALQSAYTTLDRVDLWVGGLAEDAISDTQMGVTFTAILADQFSRTRSADESFGELDPILNPGIAAEIAGTTLSEIILRNSDVETLQEDVFHAMTRMAGSEDADRMRGTKETDLMIGLGDNDDLRGGNGNDELQGGDGADRLRGQNGDDVVMGGAGNDFILGQRGDDTLDGGDGRDIIRGGAGEDVIFGGAGNDRVRGNAGDDRIDLGAGNDRASGDGGADTFVFAAGYDVDTIMDFRVGEDQIDLTGTDLSSFAELLSTGLDTRNRIAFEIGDDTLILRKIAMSDLDENDFIFG